MVKVRKKKQPRGGTVKYDSDDERAYSKEAVPDSKSDGYFMDEMDEFHANREKILLDKGAELEPAGFSSDDQEGVLGIESDSDDEDFAEMKQRMRQLKNKGFKDEMNSDLDDDEDEDDEDEGKKWGSMKKRFYGGHDLDVWEKGVSDDEPDAAELEEKEALAIQRRMMEQLDDQDVGLDIFKVDKEVVSKPEVKHITTDLSAMSKREKLQLLKKQAPELMDLVEDFKTRMQELMDRLLPILEQINNGNLSARSSGASYIQTKVHLYLNYLVNVNFYVMLRAKRTPVENHPVIKRLVQYRNLLKQLDEIEPKVKSEMSHILDLLEKGEELPTPNEEEEIAMEDAAKFKRRKQLKAVEPGKSKPSKKLSQLIDQSEDEESGSEVIDDEPDLNKGGRTWGRKRSNDVKETSGEKQALEYYDMMKAGRKSKVKPENDEEIANKEYDEVGEKGGDEEMELEEDEDERRGIDYQIAKNKGLTPKRKKELRNPRVKYKLKHRKAKIRRKGQVREVRREIEKYSGEISGIRAGIKKSIRLK